MHRDTYVGGDKWPSVTEIVGVIDKPFLVEWASKNPNYKELSEKATERGRTFHDALAWRLANTYGISLTPGYEYGVGISADGSAEKAGDAVYSWINATQFKPTALEQYVVNYRHRYGGSFDCIGFLPGQILTIIDWKLTNQISDTYVLQMAGYWGALKDKAGEARVIRPYQLIRSAKHDFVKQTAEGYKYGFKGSNWFIEERRYTNLHHYFEVFLNCRAIWDFINRKGSWEQ